MKHIHSVLLDVDGTLIDSNEQHAHAWHDYLKNKGINVPVERLSLMIGMGGDKLLTELYRRKLSEKEIKKMSQERDELYLASYASRVKPIPGAVEFVGQMASRGLRVALATSAADELLESIFRILPIEPFLVGYTTSSEVKHSKPSPDIFLTAIKKFGFEAPRTVVVGDTPYDIEAAKAVPCRVIAVLTGHYPFYMLGGADELWRDAQHLTRNMHKSLLAL